MAKKGLDYNDFDQNISAANVLLGKKEYVKFWESFRNFGKNKPRNDMNTNIRKWLLNTSSRNFTII